MRERWRCGLSVVEQERRLARAIEDLEIAVT